MGSGTEHGGAWQQAVTGSVSDWETLRLGVLPVHALKLSKGELMVAPMAAVSIDSCSSPWRCTGVSEVGTGEKRTTAEHVAMPQKPLTIMTSRLPVGAALHCFPLHSKPSPSAQK